MLFVGTPQSKQPLHEALVQACLSVPPGVLDVELAAALKLTYDRLVEKGERDRASAVQLALMYTREALARAELQDR